MTQSMKDRIREILELDVKALRRIYSEVFGTPPPRWCHRGALARRIAWQIQANEYGGLTKSTTKRLEELARRPDMRVYPDRDPLRSTQPASQKKSYRFRSSSDPKQPLPGTTLVRRYKGRSIRVIVRPDGYEYEHNLYRSLSAVAKHVTRAHCSGLAFFGLAKSPDQKAQKRGAKS